MKFRQLVFSFSMLVFRCSTLELVESRVEVCETLALDSELRKKTLLLIDQYSEREPQSSLLKVSRRVDTQFYDCRMVGRVIELAQPASQKPPHPSLSAGEGKRTGSKKDNAIGRTLVKLIVRSITLASLEVMRFDANIRVNCFWRLYAFAFYFPLFRYGLKQKQRRLTSKEHALSSCWY